MKAIRFSTFGAPDVLQYEDVETPAPGPGQVRIEVAGSGVSPADGGIRAGALGLPVSLPHIPGFDVSGTVDALGEGVDGFRVGQPVIAFLPMSEDGSAAQYVIAPVEVVAAAPATIDLVDAAGMPSVALTAAQALFDEAHLQSGQRVLIVGAGGAVGGYAVQLAVRAGAHVIATASPRSEAAVRRAGAHQIVDHTSATLRDAVTEPVDVLLNLAPLHPDDVAALAGLVRDGGVAVSTTAWMPAPEDPARGVRGIVMFVRSDGARLADLVALVDTGELRVPAPERVPLRDLPAVHERLAAGEVHDKVVAVPDGR